MNNPTSFVLADASILESFQAAMLTSKRRRSLRQTAVLQGLDYDSHEPYV
jgi:hypothetical protein